MEYIELTCDVCKNKFQYSKALLRRKEIYKKKYSKTGDSYIICKNKECISERRRIIAKKVTSNAVWIEKADKYRRSRKGKKLIDIYSKEGYENTIASAKKNFDINRLRTGKKHSEEAKIKMRNSRIRVCNTTDRWERHSKHVLSLITPEYRERLSLAAVKARRSTQNKHSISGVYIDKKWREITYDSSYELLYMLQLDRDNIERTKNTELYIPYKKGSTTKRTIPDFIIGNKIVEVKPLIFTLDSTKGVYSDTTRAKIEGMKLYCIENNLEFVLITEKDLDLSLIDTANEIMQSEKNYKKDVSRRAASILSVSTINQGIARR